MFTLFALFHHNVGAVTQMQSLYVHAICLFSDNLGAVKGSCLCVCTLLDLFPHNVGAVTQMQSMYMHAICSKAGAVR